MLLIDGKAWATYEIRVATKELQESNERARVESKRQTEIIRAEVKESNRVAVIESANQRNVKRVKRETCDFWVSEYSKSETAYNKAMMDHSLW